MDRHDEHLSLLWGLEAIAWVFRGADGGQWNALDARCLPGLARALLLLESRGLADPAILDLAEELHAKSSQNPPDASLAPEALESEYVRLFVNHRAGLSVPLCQSCYEEEGLLMGAAAEKMQIRLDRAGLQVDASLALPPDHVSIEIAYLMSLFPEQDASASARDRTDESPATFVAEALAPWMGDFVARLEQSAAHPLFLISGATLAAIVRWIGDPSVNCDHGSAKTSGPGT